MPQIVSCLVTLLSVHVVVDTPPTTTREFQPTIHSDQQPQPDSCASSVSKDNSASITTNNTTLSHCVPPIVQKLSLWVASCQASGWWPLVWSRLSPSKYCITANYVVLGSSSGHCYVTQNCCWAHPDMTKAVSEMPAAWWWYWHQSDDDKTKFHQHFWALWCSFFKGPPG